MLQRVTLREQIAYLLDHYTQAVQDAFIQAISELRSQIVLAHVIERLEKGDINGAIAQMHLDKAALNPMLDRIAEAYNAGGIAAVNALPDLKDPNGGRVVVRFDVRNPRAEAYLKEQSSTLVTQIIDDQRAGIRAALEDGLARGQNPRQTALEVVGRIDTTGKRTGGVIGLTSGQGEWVRKYRRELETGDPNALTRTLRDRRFDRTVARSIREGQPLTSDQVNRMVTAYENRALKYRADAIGRTETLRSLNASSEQAMLQAIDEGKVEARTVTKKWVAHLDGRTRDTHIALNGQTVPIGGVFQSPSGAQLRYPGDPRAPAAETISCRCYAAHTIDFFAGLK